VSDEVAIVSSWFDSQCPQVVAVYAAREAAEAFVFTQQQHAKDNPALAYERDHKYWAIRVYPVLDQP
jgi:hypothetical protein